MGVHNFLSHSAHGLFVGQIPVTPPHPYFRLNGSITAMSLRTEASAISFTVLSPSSLPVPDWSVTWTSITASLLATVQRDCNVVQVLGIHKIVTFSSSSPIPGPGESPLALLPQWHNFRQVL